jgi:hypothetical protein
MRFRIGFVLFLSCMAAVPGFAGSLQVYTGVVGGSISCNQGGGPPAAITAFFSDTLGFGIPIGGIAPCGLSGQVNNVSQGTGPLNSNYNLNNVALVTGATSSGSASASANYGNVDATASTTINGVVGGTGLSEAVAFGIDNDTLNIPGSGSGFMSFGFEFGGSLEVGNPGNGGEGQEDVVVQVGNIMQEVFYAGLSGTTVGVEGEELDSAGAYAFGEPVPGCVTGSGSFTCTNATFSTSMLPITFGMPMTFDFGLASAVEADDDQTVASDPPNISLNSIQVYNASGQMLQDFTIQSGSGAVYGADGIEAEPANTPEPSSFVLAGIGLTIAGVIRRRRRA